MTQLLFPTLGVLLIAVTLPLVLELAMVTAAQLLPAQPLRARPASRFPQPDPATQPFRLFVLVPAHNEEFLVARCVLSLRAASSEPGTTIHVIAHNCTDRTAANARAAGARVLVYDDPSARGKGFALRYGFEQALAGGADAVLVVDADSEVSSGAISAVRAAMQSGSAAVQCRYEMVSATMRSSTRLAALAFRAFNVIRPRGRERLGLSAGILGNGFALASPVLRRVPYDAFSVVEDLEYHLHLVMAGERVRYLDSARVTADFPESRAGESVQRSRWEGGRLSTARQLAPSILGRILTGQLRLIEPFCDLAGLPLAYAAFALILTAALPLAWARWYAAVSLTIFACHVLAAAYAGPSFASELRLLAMAPFYILRKLWMIPGVLRGSSSKAAWVRTERDTTL
jgi:cellulose synthase/poly-beta-1,6-N-acetylglucosamine synthase-like glycosyltransferase